MVHSIRRFCQLGIVSRHMLRTRLFQAEFGIWIAAGFMIFVLTPVLGNLISQALANVYGLKVIIAERFSIRGSIEAGELFDSLKGHFGRKDKESAISIVKELAAAYQVTEVVMTKMLEDVYNDPYNELIRNIWA